MGGVAAPRVSDGATVTLLGSMDSIMSPIAFHRPQSPRYTDNERHVYNEIAVLAPARTTTARQAEAPSAEDRCRSQESNT